MFDDSTIVLLTVLLWHSIKNDNNMYKIHPQVVHITIETSGKIFFPSTLDTLFNYSVRVNVTGFRYATSARLMTKQSIIQCTR